MSKIIVIEGTDCSGKETQSKMLIEKLTNEGIKCAYFSFPQYDTPTGRIIAGPYLGKEYVCDGWFEEGAVNVDPKVSSLYYAADRKYNILKVKELIDQGYNVILDRYTYSNMAHQGGKIVDKKKRLEMYKWVEKLEFDLLELPKCDIGVFLYLETEVSLELKKNRKESLDQNERDMNHLKNAENAYKELAKLYNFKTIHCSSNNKVRTIEDINEELYNFVKIELN